MKNYFSHSDKGKWFTEHCPEGGCAFSLQLTEKGRLHHEKTRFQTIEIYDTTHFGKLMVIDGCTMLSSRDNFLYHEMMAHPVLFSHPNPKNVVIIGGGDCGTLREVLRHPHLTTVKQIEIDERVTRLAEQYFPELCVANYDPRAELLFLDGIDWIAKAADQSIDVIIVDSTDPVGPAEGLFNQAFFRQCYRVLAEQGVLVQQGESPLLHLPLIQQMHQAMLAAGFDQTKILSFPQPIYPSGFWSATLAGKQINLDAFRFAAATNKSFPTRYYNAHIHRGALTTPTFVAEELLL